MISTTLKNVIRKSLNIAGLEVRTRDASLSGRYARSSLRGILQQARNVGLLPATVIDVGAAYGSFALECHIIFPDARYILIEPLGEYRAYLESVTEKIPNSEYVLAAATAESGEIVINVHPDLVGSSLYREDEDSDVNGVPRTVQAIELDSLLGAGRIKPPFLLKIDVQGVELDVLSGSEKILRGTEYLILEVSFFKFFEGGPRFHEVVSFMNSKGFVAYDIYGLAYRPLDKALSQVDISFVKKAGLFQEHHYYATPTQREEQNKRFERSRRELSRGLIE